MTTDKEIQDLAQKMVDLHRQHLIVNIWLGLECDPGVTNEYRKLFRKSRHMGWDQFHKRISDAIKNILSEDPLR